MLLFAEISSGRAFVSRQPCISKEGRSAAGCSLGPCVHLTRDQGLLASLAPWRGQVTLSSLPAALGQAGCQAGALSPPSHGHQRASRIPRVSFHLSWRNIFLLDAACFPEQSQKHCDSDVLLQSNNSTSLSLCSGNPTGGRNGARNGHGHAIQCLGVEAPPVTRY